MDKEYMAIGISDDPHDIIVNPDHVQHYGIIGMKWGRRRLRKISTKAAIARINNTPDATKLTKKEQKVRKRFNKTYRDSALRETVKKEKMGKVLVKTGLLGSYGAMKYDKVRANGGGRGKAILKGALSTFGNRAALNVPQIFGGVYNRHRK